MRKSFQSLLRAIQRKLFVRVCIANGTIVRPGDTLILRTDVHLTDEELAVVRANFTEKFPGVGLIRLSASSDIAFICHPVGDSCGNAGADCRANCCCQDRVTATQGKGESSKSNTKDSIADNHRLTDSVDDNLGSQTDWASPDFAHSTTPKSNNKD